MGVYLSNKNSSRQKDRQNDKYKHPADNSNDIDHKNKISGAEGQQQWQSSTTAKLLKQKDNDNM